MCGLSFTQDHKNSLEKDRSFEVINKEEAQDDDDDEEDDVDDEGKVHLVLFELQENEEKEAAEEAGERGFLDECIISGMGSCEMTSLSWIWTLLSSFSNFFFGLHLLMQEPIFLICGGSLWEVEMEIEKIVESWARQSLFFFIIS